MNKSSITIFVVIIVILAGGYFYMNSTPPESDSALQQVDNSVESNIGTQIPAILSEVQRLRIDTAIFNNASYVSLIDHSVEIVPQGVGRANPFAPLPGFSSTVSNTTTPTPVPKPPTSKR